jgi:hypothetical protein
MRALKTLLCLGALTPFALGAALADDTDFPEAVQQTQQLNTDQAQKAAQDSAQYQQQQQQYQEQQQRYQAQREAYEEQAQRYQAARDRYAAERARYRRGDWPTRYERLTFVDTDEVIGAPVETYSGSDVGRVDNIARSPSGNIDAVRVALNDRDAHVWIDRSDLKYDTDDRLVVTNLSRHDLYSMSAERY